MNSAPTERKNPAQKAGTGLNPLLIAIFLARVPIKALTPSRIMSGKNCANVSI